MLIRNRKARKLHNRQKSRPDVRHYQWELNGAQIYDRVRIIGSAMHIKRAVTFPPAITLIHITIPAQDQP